MDINSILGLFAGITSIIYIIGGIIVNSYLERYGVSEYQVVRAKYLAVGIVFALFVAVNSLLTGILILSALFLLFLVNLNIAESVELFTALAMMPWSIGFLYLVATKRPLHLKTREREIIKRSIGFNIIVSLMLVYPIGTLAAYLGNVGFPLVTNPYFISLIFVLTLLGTSIYFGRHIYAFEENWFGQVALLGTGIPVPVRLGIDTQHIGKLKELQVTTSKNGVTTDVLLLDETDRVYIIGIKHEGSVRAAKVDKDIVKIVYYDRN